jgi:hypothetical protein
VKPVAVTVGLMVFGWALVAAAESRMVLPDPEVVTRVEIVTVEAEVPEPVETPYADSLVDWDEHDRQEQCLWRLLQDSGVELTFEVVMAAGVWTDALGGACLVIGDDGEEQG